jgi:23S rRNA (uridine2552-2'-O)-methyltransferase
MQKRGRTKPNKNKWADHYTKKARDENYPARSVYKLMEIQKRFRVIKKNARVLDLGCAPGSWLIHAAEIAGPSGQAVGIDLKPVEAALPANAVAYTGDIFEMEPTIGEAVGKEYDAVISDMAPATTGRKDIDAARSFALCEAALRVACDLLAVKGNFVCKIFQGAEFKQFENLVKARFDQHKIFKPDSCRKSSKEIYIIGLSKK